MSAGTGTTWAMDRSEKRHSGRANVHPEELPGLEPTSTRRWGLSLPQRIYTKRKCQLSTSLMQPTCFLYNMNFATLGGINKLRGRRGSTKCDIVLQGGGRILNFVTSHFKNSIKAIYSYQPNWNNSIEKHWTLYIEILNQYTRNDIHCSLSAIILELLF